MALWDQVLDALDNKTFRWAKGTFGVKSKKTGKVQKVCVMGALGMLVHQDYLHFDLSTDQNPLTAQERKELVAFAETIIEQYPDYMKNWVRENAAKHNVFLPEKVTLEMARDFFDKKGKAVIRSFKRRDGKGDLVSFIIEFNDASRTREADIIKVMEKTTIRLAEQV